MKLKWLRASVGSAETPSRAYRVALVGNPNTGKSALFNALTGVRAKTANYPGTTVDVRTGAVRLPESSVVMLDLPGLYSLSAITPEEKLTSQILHGEFEAEGAPDAVLLVVDATNIERNLFLASEVLELHLPTIVALNLKDAADAAGISVDVAQLAQRLNCPVIPVSARTRQGLDQLHQVLDQLLTTSNSGGHFGLTSCTEGCTGCQFAARYDWAQAVASEAVQTPSSYGQTTGRIDRVLTHPAAGLISFLCLILGVFYLIFATADIPMSLIEEGFARVGAFADRLIPQEPTYPALWSAIVFCGSAAIIAFAFRLARLTWTPPRVITAAAGAAMTAMLPVDDFRSLLVDGVIGGVGGVLVFLPQICILFFFVALLEDSGYLARAAFVMERIMRRVGLPGQAFVPMLSAHACAIPGIMATRVIENWRDRLVTILVLPLLTCSARLPVYGMVAALLFGDSSAQAALVFLGAYMLGLVASLSVAFCLKHTLLRGETAPMLLELPPYRLPSIRSALLSVLDRAHVFVRRAGTIILLISVVLWALASYPKATHETTITGSTAQQVRGFQTDEATAGESDQATGQGQLAYSWAGRLGRATEPIFQPLGFDWKINVGILCSFAAREVIVSTLAVIYGIGEDAAEDTATLSETLRSQTRSDGSPVYTTATCLSLLVFYVLAMQCLPTQAVTKRETGSWKWAIFQLVYMTLLAYGAALVTYQIAVRVT